jgi:hypothetical protein
VLVSPPSIPIVARIQRYGRRQGSCLIWTGPLRRGYADASVQGKHFGVHRWVLEQKIRRTLAPGEFACHTCDTPACIEAEHLFAGSAKENNADCVAKERHARGEAVNTAKLTEEQVLEIRRRRSTGEGSSALALAYGLSRSTVKRICSGRYWRHV